MTDTRFTGAGRYTYTPTGAETWAIYEHERTGPQPATVQEIDADNGIYWVEVWGVWHTSPDKQLPGEFVRVMPEEGE